MTITIHPHQDAVDFDPAVFLHDAESVIAFVNDAFETKSASYVADALGIASRAEGMTQIAKLANLGRESLYKALSKDGNPKLSTILAVLDALGLEIAVQKKHEETRERELECA